MKFNIGDIVERKGTKVWKSDKKGLITIVEYRHGDPYYGVIWFGSERRAVMYYEKNDLKMHQQA